MNAQQAKDRMNELGKDLTAYSFSHGLHVLVIHQDGSRMDFNYAFCVEEEGWVFIFTEHNGYHRFWKEDLDLLVEYNTNL